MPGSQQALSTYAIERKRARRYLGRGLLFLLFCLIVAHAAEYFAIPFYSLISESGYIAGWVALWRPMEMYLYDLPELKRVEK